MSLHPVLIAGQWRPARSSSVFTAENPVLGQTLPGEYPISDWSDCDDALTAAVEAATLLRASVPEALARFFEAFAGRIEARKAELVDMAHAETGLPRSPRLADVELPRTTGQLRQAAAAVREGSWALPTIDSKLNIRSLLVPIGPVWIFGPNNFPFAFNSVAGRRFRGGAGGREPGYRESQQLASGHDTPAGRGGLRRDQRGRPARRQRAARLSHQPRRRRAAGRPTRAPAPPATPAAALRD